MFGLRSAKMFGVMHKVVKYLTKEEFEKYHASLEKVRCENCGKTLGEVAGVLSKICPKCKHKNFITVGADQASQCGN